MLKELEFVDFSQFIAALRAAEKLDLHYTVERKHVAYKRQVTPLGLFGQPLTDKIREEEAIQAIYCLTILPDETERNEDEAAYQAAS